VSPNNEAPAGTLTYVTRIEVDGQFMTADANPIAFIQTAFSNLLVIDKQSVGAPQISQEPPVTFVQYFCVVVGDFSRNERYVVGLMPPKGDSEMLPQVECIAVIIRRQQQDLSLGDRTLHGL
jgi:hypothetical protein